MAQAKNSNNKEDDSQKVEVVVQSPDGEVNIFGELSILFVMQLRKDKELCFL